MPSLYRQYRPQFFKDIAGQAHVTETLQQAILKDKVSHAYLFQGPRGTGKTTTARVFAKRLNCAKPKKAEPCGKCNVCVATQEQRNMDIIEIDAASNRGIDDIRALRERVGLAPTLGTTKVYIIDEVHMLTNEAFAALLKTLEEPRKHVVFILATTELHKVPDTILSRCQVFRFRRASEVDMRGRLKQLLEAEEREVEDEVLNFVIGRSDGCFRDAESLLGQLLTAHDGILTLEALTNFMGLPDPRLVERLLEYLVKKETAAALQLTGEAYESGFDLEQLIAEVLRTARDGLVAAAEERAERPMFAQGQQAVGQLSQVMRAFIQAGQDITFVPQPLLAVQLAIVTAAGAQSSAPIAPSAPARPTVAPALKKAPPKAVPQPVVKPSRPEPVTQVAATAALAPPPVKEKAVPEAPESGGIAVSQVETLWPQVIDRLKEDNPVSSTFLRATKPLRIEGKVLVLQVQFPLHRTFFEKDQNKTSVEKILSELVNTELKVRCELNDNAEAAAQIQEEVRKKEQELLQNVKEVFGVQV